MRGRGITKTMKVARIGSTVYSCTLVRQFVFVFVFVFECVFAFVFVFAEMWCSVQLHIAASLGLRML